MHLTIATDDQIQSPSLETSRWEKLVFTESVFVLGLRPVLPSHLMAENADRRIDGWIFCHCNDLFCYFCRSKGYYLRPEGRQVRPAVIVAQDWTSTQPSPLVVQLMHNDDYIYSSSFSLQPYTWLAGCSRGPKLNSDVRKTLAHQIGLYVQFLWWERPKKRGLHSGKYSQEMWSSSWGSKGPIES